MRYPSYNPGAWERNVYNDIHLARDPDWSAYRNQVRLHHVAATEIDFRARLCDEARIRREQRYQDFEARAHQAWLNSQ